MDKKSKKKRKRDTEEAGAAEASSSKKDKKKRKKDSEPAQGESEEPAPSEVKPPKEKKHKKDKKDKKSKETVVSAEPVASSSTAPSSSDAEAFLKKHEVTLHVPDGVPTPTPILSFKQLDIPAELRAAFDGFKEPTPIQACSWPPALEGRDVVGIAETGRYVHIQSVRVRYAHRRL